MNAVSQANKKAAESIPFYDKYKIVAGDTRRLAVSKTFMKDLGLDAMPDFEIKALTSHAKETLSLITIKSEDESWDFNKLAKTATVKDLKRLILTKNNQAFLFKQRLSNAMTLDEVIKIYGSTLNIRCNLTKYTFFATEMDSN
jgi:hypothetical protein